MRRREIRDGRKGDWRGVGGTGGEKRGTEGGWGGKKDNQIKRCDFNIIVSPVGFHWCRRKAASPVNIHLLPCRETWRWRHVSDLINEVSVCVSRIMTATTRRCAWRTGRRSSTNTTTCSTVWRRPQWGSAHLSFFSPPISQSWLCQPPPFSSSIYSTEPRVYQRDHVQWAVHDRVGRLSDEPQHLPVQPAGGAEQLHRLLPSTCAPESSHAAGQLYRVGQPRQRAGAGHPAHQDHRPPPAEVSTVATVTHI